MATVKSLEERIDQLADEFANQQRAFDVLTTRLDLVVNQLSTIASQLSSISSQLGTLEKDYASFKADTSRTLSMVRWIGVFAAGVLVTVIISAFSLARSAGSLETTVQQQQKTLEEIRHGLAELHSKQK